MTTTEPTELAPCARGCTHAPRNEDEAPTPKPATHGYLCSACYYRITTALTAIPELITNMRSQITPGGGQTYSERIQGGGDGSPAPLNIDALDASDSLYAKLASWSEVFAGELQIPQPHWAAWINFREVQGMRGNITPEDAGEISDNLVQWFLALAESIAATSQAVEFHDDLCFGWDDARGVFPLLGRYGSTPRPPKPAAGRECPVCGNDDVFVKWPDKLNPDLEVMCGRCKHMLDPDLVNPHARNFDGATASATWVDALPPVPRRCTGSADCTADTHRTGCLAVITPRKATA